MLNQGTALLLFVSARVHQVEGWHMHDGSHAFGHSWGCGASLVHTLLGLLVLAAIIITTILLTRRLGSSRAEKSNGKVAMDRLDERYANGEIDREEYLQRKKDILER
ncbi:hypothetical protein GCM10023115_19930 [Pontixanthobacter gangjinensis]|uniref:SHOCT domain-containing protein n=1 Tax=Pontixanthobacter gangjinensis TaxID=1028742 RepID=A0A6I4SMX1_9SPHN|nr:SHOCT domain-containing protein [Pontixanthobacter gangjinensis]MXO57241.1 hypothetical protein [Pontixanthobacter gangjinensis]